MQCSLPLFMRRIPHLAIAKPRHTRSHPLKTERANTPLLLDVRLVSIPAADFAQ